MVQKLELLVKEFDFFGTVRPWVRVPPSRPERKTALIIRFEMEFQNFIYCLFFALVAKRKRISLCYIGVLPQLYC